LLENYFGTSLVPYKACRERWQNLQHIFGRNPILLSKEKREMENLLNPLPILALELGIMPALF
jgi:hypothetical protein